MSVYKEALCDILECTTLLAAKEIAADILDVDVQEFLDSDNRDMDFNDEEYDIDPDDVLSLFD